MRSVAFSVGTTFLLPPVSFVAALKLSRPRIHTSEWVQYSTPGLFFCEWRCVYLLVLISFSGNYFLLELFLVQFQCCCFHRLILKYPSVWIDPFAWVYSRSWRCSSVDTHCFDSQPLLLSFCCSILNLSFWFLILQYLTVFSRLLYSMQLIQCHQRISCLRCAL